MKRTTEACTDRRGTYMHDSYRYSTHIIETSELNYSMRSAYAVNIRSVTLGCSKLPYDSFPMYKYILTRTLAKQKEKIMLIITYKNTRDIMASSIDGQSFIEGAEISQC